MAYGLRSHVSLPMQLGGNNVRKRKRIKAVRRKLESPLKRTKHSLHLIQIFNQLHSFFNLYVPLQFLSNV